MSSPIRDAIIAGEPLTGTIEVVDIHAHGGPWFNFWIPNNDCDSMARLLDSMGVRALVLSSHLSIGPGAEDGNNLTLAFCRAHPGRFYGYAVLFPHHPVEVIREELNRALDSGLVAIKLHPSTHRYRLTDVAYQAAWEVAQERKTFILSHSWYGDSHCAPGLFAEMAQQFPDVPVILGHSGGVPDGFKQTIDLAKRHTCMYLDTTGSYVTGAWVRRMVEAVGAERVVYGSDMPFIDPRYGLGKVALSGLDERQLGMVLGQNARRLLASAGTHLS